MQVGYRTLRWSAAWVGTVFAAKQNPATARQSNIALELIPTAAQLLFDLIRLPSHRRNRATNF